MRSLIFTAAFSLIFILNDIYFCIAREKVIAKSVQRLFIDKIR